MNLPLLPDFSKQFTQLYLLALSAVAFLTIMGQVIVQNFMGDQISDSRVVNVAGRQRMLSQRICKTSILLSQDTTIDFKEPYHEELDKALELWRESHAILQSGYLKLDKPVRFTNSPKIKSMFKEMNPYFIAIYTNAELISSNIHLNNGTTTPQIRECLLEILKNEREFLKRMDKIVFQYDAEAKERVHTIKTIELVVTVLTLLILAFEALFVFNPASQYIVRTIDYLVHSEQKTQKVNEELLRTNVMLQETEHKLIQATREKYVVQINEQKIRTASLVEGQEEERKRMARELHDGIGQMLTALKFTVEKLDKKQFIEPKQLETYQYLKQLVLDTIKETRSISFSLMPSVLQDFGLTSALKILCEQTFHNTSTEIIFNSNCKDLRMDPNVEIGLYRIAQEALTNSIKYAQTKRIDVELMLHEDNLKLLVTDYGIGFDKTELRSKKKQTILKNGVYNMQARAQLINAQYHLATAIGKGTKISVNLSIKKIEHEENTSDHSG